jgi:hypothetical protein
MFTLLEGQHLDNLTKHILRCDRLLLTGGGIGITAFMPSATGTY